MPLGLKSIFKYIIVNSITPVYNFINDRLVDESTDLNIRDYEKKSLTDK